MLTRNNAVCIETEIIERLAMVVLLCYKKYLSRISLETIVGLILGRFLQLLTYVLVWSERNEKSHLMKKEPAYEIFRTCVHAVDQFRLFAFRYDYISFDHCSIIIQLDMLCTHTFD